MKFLVRRAGALGDVILTTPVLRRLRREHPGAEIVMSTAYPAVFHGNTAVDMITGTPCMRGADRFIALDLAYERRPAMHIVEAYMTEAFGDRGAAEDRQQTLTYDRRPIMPDRHRFVAVHATNAGWRNRTLPPAVWMEVAKRLAAAGLWPVLVGTHRDDLPGFGCTRFFTPDIAAQAQVIASCKCFVGSDSALLHIAGATDVPIVGVFTCARPEYRLPWRHGVLGDNCTAVLPALDCIGCLERQTAPVTTESCERGDIACVRNVSAEMISTAVLNLIETQVR